MICKEVDAYFRYVKDNPDEVCIEQKLMVALVEYIFETEDVHIDTDQLERYLGLQKYFPYQLLDWEKCIFALHNCCYTAEGDLRFPELVVIVGRGSGKNGYLAFENFALVTPINGIKEYNIDMFATSEDQAKSTFDDIHNVLEENETYFKNYFYWNQECITNLKTNSKIRYHTSAPRTKDGGRPGKVDYDEYHAYRDYALIDVVDTGLGKKKHPRKTIISTLGNERDGPMDRKMDDCLDILNQRIPDNGTLAFICRLDADEEVDEEKNWRKANPSLRFFSTLLKEIRREYFEYKRDPVNHSAFMTKRMNRPKMDGEDNVTDWDNLVKATTAIDLQMLKGRSCVAGIDYATTDDFMAAGLLFRIGDKRYWIYHVWVCKHSKDLHRIKFPLAEAEADGVLTWVLERQISPALVMEWLADQMRIYRVEMLAMDAFRYMLFADALMKMGFSVEKKNLKLVRPSDIMKVSIVIGYIFSMQQVIWGVSKIMRWFAWNTKAVRDTKGNITYEKKEEKSRKTDGFLAFTAAMACEDRIKQIPIFTGGRMGTIT